MSLRTATLPPKMAYTCIYSPTSPQQPPWGWRKVWQLEKGYFASWDSLFSEECTIGMVFGGCLPSRRYVAVALRCKL